MKSFHLDLPVALPLSGLDHLGSGCCHTTFTSPWEAVDHVFLPTDNLFVALLTAGVAHFGDRHTVDVML